VILSDSNPLRDPEDFEQHSPEPCAIIVFGITGDLARRKLLPALYRLVRDGRMPQRFTILGAGRKPLSQEENNTNARQAIESAKETGVIEAESLERFLRNLEYVQIDDEPASFMRLGRTLERLELSNQLYYFSTPPSAYAQLARNIGAAGLNSQATGWRRIIVEKPFGTTLKSAQELNLVMHSVFEESQIYRIDHFLGKETVQNMLSLRFANAIFEPILNRNYVDHVQITAAEDLGMEGRGAFYEEAGILRDMIQNHVMQLVCLTAMEPPISRWVGSLHPLEAGALRDEKVKVIRALKPLDPERDVVLGQYGPGSLYGEAVAGYRGEDKVSATSETATYAALRLQVDNWRWAGVPFYLRSAKRMPKKSTEIAIVFKRPPLAMFPQTAEPNVLALNIQPEQGVSLRFDAKVPGLETRLRAVNMDFSYTSFGAEGPTAYERLILDCLLGDASLFPREDEVEASWAWIDPLIQRPPAVKPYSAGSWGPEAAEGLLQDASPSSLERRWRKL
jgi:glucose-6-phosphate 1-dehydrogenase